MSTSEAFPDVADVERFGNLLLSAWSPPSGKPLAEAWVESVVAALLKSHHNLVLLGHRPGKAKNLCRDELSDETRYLFDSFTQDPNCSSLYRFPPEAARVLSPLLRSGDIHVRQRITDESTGLTRIDSTHLGRVLILSSLTATLQAIQNVDIDASLQVTLSCLTNPYAGLRQPDSKWLRSIRSWSSAEVAIGWQDTSLQILAGRDTLRQLRNNLLDWLPTSGNRESFPI